MFSLQQDVIFRFEPDDINGLLARGNVKDPCPTLRWYGTLKWTKSLFKYGEERPIVWYCTQEEKLNFESFTQKGCHGNQPQPSEVVFYSIDANTSCFFTKQDLTVK